MERRTCCLQSNVDFLKKTITKLSPDHQQKIDAANRQIEALKGAVIALQKIVDELQEEDGRGEKADARRQRMRRRPPRRARSSNVPRLTIPGIAP